MIHAGTTITDDHPTRTMLPDQPVEVRLDTAGRSGELHQCKINVTCRPKLMIGSIILADLSALALSALVAIYSWWLIKGGYQPGLYLALWPVLSVFIIAYACVKLYPAVPLSSPEELRRLTFITSLVYLSLGTATFLFKESTTYSRAVLLIAYTLSLVTVPPARGLLRSLCSSRNWWGYPAVVFGNVATASKVVAALVRQPAIGLKPVAILSDDEDNCESIHGVPVAGDLSLSEEIAKRFHIRYGICTLPDLSPGDNRRLMEKLSQSYYHLIVMPELSGFSSLWVTAIDLGGMLGLEVRHRLLDPGRRVLKRVIEYLIIAVSSPILLPLLGLIALAIKIESRGPVFYSQQRIGVGGKHFSAWKFRTMVRCADRVLDRHLSRYPELRDEWETTHKLKNDPRITKVGWLLRKTSLDELPQIWNVIRGDMSLVGPRPIVDEEIEKYGDSFSLYKQVLPGMTGIWQVSGRNNLTYDQRVLMDAYYVRNWSVWLDLYLLARTFRAVFLCKGAY